MGNRAIIITQENFENDGTGVYLHWNGGRDSVAPFLKYCELRGFRTPDSGSYGWARFVQVVANFFGMDGLSIGVDKYSNLPSGEYCDNGVYIIKGWEIVDRKFFDDCEEQDGYDFNEMLHAIDERQPEPLGAYLDAEEVPVTDLKVGDKVYIRDWNNRIKEVTVLDFGEDILCNGTNVKGMPYAEICGGTLGKKNINNYIQDKTVKRVAM